MASNCSLIYRTPPWSHDQGGVLFGPCGRPDFRTTDAEFGEVAFDPPRARAMFLALERGGRARRGPWKGKETRPRLSAGFRHVLCNGFGWRLGNDVRERIAPDRPAVASIPRGWTYSGPLF